MGKGHSNYIIYTDILIVLTFMLIKLQFPPTLISAVSPKPKFVPCATPATALDVDEHTILHLDLALRDHRANCLVNSYWEPAVEVINGHISPYTGIHIYIYTNLWGLLLTDPSKTSSPKSSYCRATLHLKPHVTFDAIEQATVGYVQWLIWYMNTGYNLGYGLPSTCKITWM